MKRVLFVCGQTELRSPTAERLFSGRRDLEVASAGLNRESPQPVTAELLDWADVICVMEKSHLIRMRRRFRKHLNRQRLICLNIPDIYELMDPALIELLEDRVPRYLGLAAEG